jgi:gamma-glutamyltranspeptidase/glutathione hydrolase
MQAMYRFETRRSTVHSVKAIVSSSQPLASQAGIEVLRLGGNAAVGTIRISNQS